MRRPFRAMAALGLCCALALSGCGGPAPVATPDPQPSPPPVTERVEPMDFVLPCYVSGGFHPITGTNKTNLTLAPLLYRGLFALDRKFEPQKDLCSSFEVSEDGSVWKFQLVDITFSDGSPLTAAEVVASLNKARRSSRYSGRLADVEKIGVDGDKVTVTLSRPNGALPALLDIPFVKETGDPLRPLGTGPYYLEESEGELALHAREGAEVPLTVIPLRPVGASDDLVYAFDAREVSLVDTDLTGTNVPGYSGRYEVADYPTTALLYVGCNLRAGACRDQLVRQAVARAADRRSAAGKLLAGHGVAATLPIHPASRWYDITIAKGWDYDLTAAAGLLEQAGWVKNEDGLLQKGRGSLTLKLIVNQENTYKVRVAEALADSLRELGCTVTVEKLAWEKFIKALERREFDLYLGESLLTADFDLEPLLGAGGELNYGGFSDSRTEELLTAYRSAGEGEREEAASLLCERAAEMAPVIPLCFKNGSLLTQWGQVSGRTPTQRDVFAGLANWTVAQF